MNSTIDFSECLNELMRATDLKNSKLAKAINVDASLINKWLNNKSIPPYNSQHIDLIVNQIVKNTNNSYQLKHISDFIKRNLTGCSEINEDNRLELLRKLLIESQGYSIEKRKNLKKSSLNTTVHSIVNKPFTEVSMNALHVSYSNNKETSSNVQIITGYESVLSAALKLLETASAANSISTEPIMITFLTEMSKLSYHPIFNSKWRELLSELTLKGWNIIYLAHINSNNTRNNKIIEDMLIPISTGKYQVYYTNGNNYTLPFEIVLVPSVGSLICVSSVDRHQVDSAFLVKGKDAVNIFSGYFYQLLASSKPLLKSCLPIRSIGYQNDFSDIEEIPGNSFSILNELSTLTIPISLFEQNLKKSSISNDDITKKIMYHKNKIKSFESQVKHYKFHDIISEECILNTISNKKYSYLDKHYTIDDIIKHLENTIQFLKCYENYEIGLANKELIRSLPITNWTLKDNSVVLLISYASDNLGTSDMLPIPSRGFIVTQSDIVNAFENYFDNLWNQIKPDKKEVISKLENYIKILS